MRRLAGFLSILVITATTLVGLTPETASADSGGYVTGVVIDSATGQPVVGVQIDVAPAAHRRDVVSWTTDGVGWYGLVAPPGPATITITDYSGRYATAKISVTITDGQETRNDITLTSIPWTPPSRYVVAGTIVDNTGAPVRMASACLMGRGGFPARCIPSNPDGSYYFRRARPGWYRIQVLGNEASVSDTWYGGTRRRDAAWLRVRRTGPPRILAPITVVRNGWVSGTIDMPATPAGSTWDQHVSLVDSSGNVAAFVDDVSPNGNWRASVAPGVYTAVAGGTWQLGENVECSPGMLVCGYGGSSTAAFTVSPGGGTTDITLALDRPIALLQRPVITGKIRLGRVLRATKPVWSEPGLTAGYAWYRGNREIDWGRRHVVTKRDLHKPITVQVWTTSPQDDTSSVVAISEPRTR